jgi:hypothetical protein
MTVDREEVVTVRRLKWSERLAYQVGHAAGWLAARIFRRG